MAVMMWKVCLDTKSLSRGFCKNNPCLCICVGGFWKKFFLHYPNFQCGYYIASTLKKKKKKAIQLLCFLKYGNVREKNLKNLKFSLFNILPPLCIK